MFNRLYNYFFSGEFVLFLIFFTLFYNNIVGFEGPLLLMLAYFVYSFFRRGRVFNNETFSMVSRGFYLILLFCFVYVLIKFFSIYINQCCFEDASRYYAKYSKILYLFVFAFFLIVINFNSKSYERFILSISYSMLFMAVLEIYLIGVAPYHGILFSELGELAWFVGSVLFSTLILSVNYFLSGIRGKGLHYFSISIGLLILLILTNVRGYWLSFIITLLVLFMVWFYFSKYRFVFLAKYVLAPFVLVFSFLLLSENKFSERVLESKPDIVQVLQGDYSGSIGQRIFMFNVAWQGILESPFLGLGESNYNSYLTELADTNHGGKHTDVYKQIANYQHVHNQYLMDFWMMGFLGFFSLLFVMLYPLYSFSKMFKNQEKVVFAYTGFSFILSTGLYFLSGAVLTYSHGIVFFFFWLVMLSFLLFRNDYSV